MRMSSQRVVGLEMVLEMTELNFETTAHVKDVTVIDGSFNWALLFHHEMQVYFGSNLPR